MARTDMGRTGALPQLKRSLNFWQVAASGIGIVVGAGIYVLVGEAAKDAGGGVWISFGVAAALSGLTALTYAELASMFPSAGAEYEYGRNAVNEPYGFIAGWMMVVAYMVAAAAVSIGFGQYLQAFIAIDARVGALGLLAVLTLIVVSGIERSIWLSVALAALQITGLMLVIIAGAPQIGSRNLVEGATVPGVMSGAALVFFSFIGFDDIATLSEETNDAAHAMPRALLATLAIAGVLYMLVGISAVSVIGGDALASSDRPLALVIDRDWGGRGSDIVSVIALASTMNTTLLVLTAASRMIFSISRRGAFPAVFSRVGRRGHAPYAAALLALVVAATFASLGHIGLVASVTDFAVYAIFLMMNVAVIALRFRRPDADRPYRTPLHLGRMPILPIAAMASIGLMLAYLEPRAWLLGLAAITAGAVFWFAYARSRVGE